MYNKDIVESSMKILEIRDMEIVLCPYDSCRLLALNLYGYVKNPFTPEAEFDFELFKAHVNKSQRLMDDIVDLELEKIDKILEKIKSDPESEDIKRVEYQLWEKIKEKAIQGRRTGLGVTAEGDMLAALGIRYASEEGIEFSEKVHKLMALEAFRSSMEMSKERGSFPISDPKREINNPFIQRIKEADEDLFNDLMKYGRRNIALKTLAPTGSVSLMTQTTSGIEPVFKPYYLRRRKINPSDKSTKVSFVDVVGDSWEEYIVFHHGFLKWAEINGHKKEDIEKLSGNKLKELVEKSPYHLSTSEDIDWVNKVKLQGRIQKWIDHSISVTVNLPKDTTEEIIDAVYREAWKSGCKGITVYRDGSRDGVLVSADDKKKEEKTDSERYASGAKKRPAVLDADIVRFKNNKEDWIAFIGTIDNEPYEIFTGIIDEDKGLVIPKSVTSGKIRKVKDDVGKRYDFEYYDKHGYLNVVGGISRSFKPEYWNYSKFLSGVLRQGMPIENVVLLIKNMSFEEETINSWRNGVSRALGNYIKNGAKASGSVCPKCKQPSIVFEEGCLKCTNCGDSKCGG